MSSQASAQGRVSGGSVTLSATIWAFKLSLRLHLWEGCDGSFVVGHQAGKASTSHVCSLVGPLVRFALGDIRPSFVGRTRGSRGRLLEGHRVGGTSSLMTAFSAAVSLSSFVLRRFGRCHPESLSDICNPL